MKKHVLGFFFLTVFIGLFSTGRALAEVREIHSMREIIGSVDNETLLVFDIDNTLLNPVQTLGSDQWYRFLVDEYGKAGMDKNTAIGHAMADWYQVQLKTKVLPVEPQTPGLLRYFQSKGVKTMALTSRPPRAAAITIAQLAGAKIDFTVQAPVGHNARVVAGVPGLYDRGILFISPWGDKGKFLIEFLKQSGKWPKKIIFVDDRANNTQSVETALSQAPFQHIEFRYGFDDAWVSRFNPKIAGIEWKHFVSSGIIYDDQTAQRIGQ